MVLSMVWGMTETVKSPELTDATVRLYSVNCNRALFTIRSITACGALIVMSLAISSFFMAVTVPVLSMCPDTMCPPSRPLSVSALSRFT